MPGTLTRWDPLHELADLRSRFDRMFADVTNGSESSWSPAIDVVRDGDTLVMHADIPGMKPEEVKIAIENDVLTVSGEHEESTEEKNKHFVRRERHYGSFSRSMALPAGVDASKIEAKTHDGVLEVKIPLPAEAQKAPVEITPTAA